MAQPKSLSTKSLPVVTVAIYAYLALNGLKKLWWNAEDNTGYILLVKEFLLHILRGILFFSWVYIYFDLYIVQLGAKPLFKPMITQFTNAYMRQ